MIKIITVLVIVVLAGLALWYVFAGKQPVAVSPTPTATALSQLKGRVYFGVTDAATNLSGVTAVKVTVDQVQVQGAGDAWLTVSDQSQSFDLLALKQSGNVMLLAQADLPAGTYNQVRLHISAASVTKAGQTTTAKLPSGDLKIVGKLVVNADSTATAVVDFIADKSLHVTGKGQFILAPVVKYESKSAATAEVTSDNQLKISAGQNEASVNAGMDLNGDVEPDFMLDSKTMLEINNGLIQLKGGLNARTSASPSPSPTPTATQPSGY